MIQLTIWQAWLGGSLSFLIGFTSAALFICGRSADEAHAAYRKGFKAGLIALHRTQSLMYGAVNPPVPPADSEVE